MLCMAKIRVNMMCNLKQCFAGSSSALPPDIWWLLNIFHKCEFRKLELLFLGHQFNQYEVQADPAKTSAIQNMCPPTYVTELQLFLGMANQQGSSQVNWSKLLKLFESYLTRIGYGSEHLLIRKHSVRSKRSSASPHYNPHYMDTKGSKDVLSVLYRAWDFTRD